MEEQKKYITTGWWGLEMLKEDARTMRKYPTETESIMWNILKNRGLGVKFRRQHIFDCYIVDFVCLDKQLIIEIDGDYHYTAEQIKYNQARTEFLQSQGYKELRFDNREVLFNLDNVIKTIKENL